MALTREEINEIATMVGREVVNNIQKFAVLYQDPETVQQGLLQSGGEEQTAALWYRSRAAHARKHSDEVTAGLYEHIAREEDKHYQQFSKRWSDIEEERKGGMLLAAR